MVMKSTQKEGITMFDEHNDILTVAEVAELLYVGRNTVYDLLNNGQLQGFRMGSRSWRIPRRSLEKYIVQSCRSIQKN